MDFPSHLLHFEVLRRGEELCKLKCSRIDEFLELKMWLVSVRASHASDWNKVT